MLIGSWYVVSAICQDFLSDTGDNPTTHTRTHTLTHRLKHTVHCHRWPIATGLHTVSGMGVETSIPQLNAKHTSGSNEGPVQGGTSRNVSLSTSPQIYWHIYCGCLLFSMLDCDDPQDAINLFLLERIIFNVPPPLWTPSKTRWHISGGFP